MTRFEKLQKVNLTLVDFFWIKNSLEAAIDRMDQQLSSELFSTDPESVKFQRIFMENKKSCEEALDHFEDAFKGDELK